MTTSLTLQDARSFSNKGGRPLYLTTYTNTCMLDRVRQSAVLAQLFPHRRAGVSVGRAARAWLPAPRVQKGLDPNDWKPISSVGASVREIRIRTGREHRVLYIAKFAEAVYVLHAFEKRTRKTRKRDLEVARERLRTLIMRRRNEDVP